MPERRPDRRPPLRLLHVDPVTPPAFAQTPTPDPTPRDILLRHWNARGEKVDGKQNELPKAQYATKAAVVKARKESLAHAGEHYGQLVVYYRLNGLVPPASR